MMVCKNCGNEIRDGVKFCPHCGAVEGEASPRPVYTGPEAPVPKKGKGKLLLIGGAAAVLAVAALLAILASGLFSNPKDQLAKAIQRSVAAYEAAGDSMGMPDLDRLVETRSVSQRFVLRLNSVNSTLAGFDTSALSGLGLRMSTDLDGRDRKLGLALGAFWGEEDILSLRVLADDDKMYFSSPELTEGVSYGVNTETLGADMKALTGDSSIQNVSFNIFDLVDIAAPEGRAQALEARMKEASLDLWEAVQVEKAGRETVILHGNETKTEVYQVVIPQEALEDYGEAWLEICSSASYAELYEEMLQSTGLPQEEIDDVMEEIEELDPCSDLSGFLAELLEELGEVRLTVCVGEGCLSAIKYEDRLFEDGINVKAELYLGGGGSYVDDLRLELDVDGQKVILDSTGDRGGKSGVFTSRTTLKGPFPTITSDCSYDPRSAAGNLQWELSMDGMGSLVMAGQLTAGTDSLDLALEDISVRMMGLEICSLGLDYSIGPCQGVELPGVPAALIGDMDGFELLALMVTVESSTQSWLNSTQQMFAQRLPAQLYDTIF